MHHFIYILIAATCLMTFSNSSLYADKLGKKVNKGVEKVKHEAHNGKKEANKKFKHAKKKVNHFFKNH